MKDDMLAVFNQMYLDVRIMEQLKHGIWVCIPKTDIPSTPADCRPITWLKTEHKILAHFRANRLRPALSDMLHPSQDCGVSGNTIFDAVKTVRDAIAYAELTHAPLCSISLHFRAGINRIFHTYLLATLNYMVAA